MLSAQSSSSIFTFFKSLGLETKTLGLMAIPLIATGLVESSIGFISTTFAAHLGQAELVATALVSSLFTTLMVFMWGLFSAISTLVAEYDGARNDRAAAQVMRDALVMAFLMGLPVMGLIWAAPLFMEWLGKWQEVIEPVRICLYSFLPGIIPDFLGIVLLQFFLGLGQTRIIMVFSLFFTALNLTANYVLMFGKWGVPALGIAGIGWGASITMWVAVLFLGSALLLSRSHRKYLHSYFSGKLFSYSKELCVLGVPIGLMYCIELGFFMMIAFMIGQVDTKALAAHQIAIQYFLLLASVVFCIEKVTSVRVSYLLAEGQRAKAKMTGYSSVFLAILFMLTVAVIYWQFSLEIIAIDLNVQDEANSTIIKMTQQFLLIAAIFQIIEGVCIALFGVLRGLKDTQFTMFVSLLTFWGIALPLSYLFIIYLHWDVSWVWWSMVISATFEALLLGWRYHKKL